MWKSLYSERAERGQALVIVAVAMVGLLVVVGLAIDGGSVYLERRRMQNASDAAALAGTRVLSAAICEQPGADDAAVAAEVMSYADRNGVEDPDANVEADYVDADEAVLGRVGDGSIPAGATGVSVTAKIERSTYFVSLVGIDKAGASADALAMTGPPLVAGGLRPIGVPIEVVEDLDVDDEFTLNFKQCSDKNVEGCIVSYAGGQAEHRGYMNLAWAWNQGEDPDWPRAIDASGDANVLKDWMANGYNASLFYADCLWDDGCRYGDYIHAKPGTNSSVIGEAPVGDVIWAPVFDVVPEYDEIPGPKPPPAGQGSFYYHIVGFVAFRVTDADQGGGTITGAFVDIIVGYGQASPSAEGAGYGQNNACKSHIQVVNLWR